MRKPARVFTKAAGIALRSFVLIVSFVFFPASKSATAQSLSPAWVELGQSGKAIARIVVNDPQNCPAIQIDRANRKMTFRQPMPAGFRPVCEFEIPAGTKSASVNSRPLALPKPNPARVVAIGDTGCRIKAKRVQDCNRPEVWPFRQLAASAANEKADLVIHVGDYLYRESPCPEGSEAMCGKTPAGDTWEAWNIDFFTPAAQLLSAAPWIFTRGNHESCERSWRGWFYYLDPRPWNGTCEEYSAPYIVKLGAFELAMLDSSAAREDGLDEAQAATYASQLSALRPENAWLVAHYPFWGFKTDPHGGPPVPLVASLQSAWERAEPKGFHLILSGHIHLFELVSVDHGRPPQLVAGDGGTEMAVPIQMSMNGTQIRGASVMASRSQHQFGYTLLNRRGVAWMLELKNQTQNVLVSCIVPGGSTSCQGMGTD